MALNSLGETATVTVEAGGTTSGAIDRAQRAFLSFYLGATAWTGATFTLLAANSPDDTFLPLVDETGAALSAVPATLNAWITLPASTLARLNGFRYLKLKSVGTEVAARTVIVAMGG